MKKENFKKNITKIKNYLEIYKLQFIIGRIILIIIILIIASNIIANLIQKTASNISEKNTLSELIQNRYSLNIQLKEDYEKIKNFIPKLETFIPTIDQLSNITSALEAAAIASQNQQILTFFDLQSDAINGMSILPATVTLQGNYESFNNYLNIVSNLPFLIKINSIDISSPQNILNSAQTTININIFIKTP